MAHLLGYDWLIVSIRKRFIVISQSRREKVTIFTAITAGGGVSRAQIGKEKKQRYGGQALAHRAPLANGSSDRDS